MALDEFLAFLAVPPGSLTYHLIRLVALQAGLALAWSHLRDSRARSDRWAVWGFAVALLLQFGPLTLGILETGESRWIVGALETAIAGALVWGVALPTMSRLGPARLAPVGLSLIILATAVLWPDHSAPVWGVLTFSAFALGAAVIAWHRSAANWAGILLGCVLLGLAALIPSLVISQLGPTSLETDTQPALAGIGAGRLVAVAGYLVLLASLYLRTQTHWQDERTTLDSELRELSRSALQQTQERLFILQVVQAVNASLDLRQVLSTAAESLALGGNADRTAIALADEEDPSHLWLVASYEPLVRPERPRKGIHFRTESFASLQQAAESGQSVMLPGEVATGELVALHTLLGSNRTGPLLIQPLIHQENLVGLVLLSNAVSGRSFTEQDLRFCTALSSQVTGTIANARLYQRVSRLLQERDADASQRQAILEGIADGVIATDRKGTVILVNRAATRILRRDPESLMGRSLGSVCPELWMGGIPGQSSFELHDKVIQGTMTPVAQAEGQDPGFVAVLRDVTREIQSERAKTSFIATVSHELRTPMTAIKGYADLMSAGVGGELSDAQHDYLRIIQVNTDRMVGIVDNMIAVSEMEGEVAFALEPMDMRPLLELSIDAIQPEIERRQHSCVLRAPDKIPLVLGDPFRLRQVVGNLLSNASKFTPPGGKIEIRVRTLPAGKISPKDSGYLVVSVKDTGVGIPAHERTRVFERFYRADNPLSIEAGGPGVGLTIAQEMVERHGGRIWVDSEVGKGSTFTFIIPLAPPSP